MRILHFYPKTDAAICQYFDMLASNMGLEVENHKASTSEEARQLLRNIDFDILHVHGCWNNAQFMIVRKALQQGARLVVTPYGQLQPRCCARPFGTPAAPALEAVPVPAFKALLRCRRPLCL